MKLFMEMIFVEWMIFTLRQLILNAHTSYVK